MNLIKAFLMSLLLCNAAFAESEYGDELLRSDASQTPCGVFMNALAFNDKTFILQAGEVLQCSSGGELVNVNRSFVVKEMFVFNNELWAIQKSGRIFVLRENKWIKQGWNVKKVFGIDDSLYAITYSNKLYKFNENTNIDEDRVANFDEVVMPSVNVILFLSRQP
jgi:hypothetical protein